VTTVKKFEKAEETEKREGQIQDFVSGHWVKASPEEVDAVQIFSRRLIEDYDYPKSHIRGISLTPVPPISCGVIFFSLARA